MAKKYNRKFYHFVNGTSTGELAKYQSSYDPLAAKEGQTDLILGMRTWGRGPAQAVDDVD